MTPLHSAALSNRIEIVEALIDAGADKKKTNNDGKSPAQIAAYWGYGAIVDLLENSEERKTEVYKYGNTAGHR